jgi:Skp family chaperone for outer membrane proteins
MITLLIGIFLILFFLVTVVLSIKTWRAVHIVVVFFTFVAGVFFVICAAMSMKTHVAWRELHAKTETSLKAEQSTGEVLAYGDPQQVKSAEPSVFEIQQRLNRMLIDRGRAWRRCVPGNLAANSVTVSTVPADVPEDQVKPNGIAANSVVYVFREAPVSIPTVGEILVPASYIGEFQVTNADDRNVTLQPTMPLDGQQQQVVANRPATWALYEMMPLDNHRVFSDEDIIDQPLDDTPKPIFGEMNEQMLRTVFTLIIGDVPEVTDIVKDYIRDGSVADEQVVNTEPENIWVKLEFQKPHTERVDSNNLDSGLSGNYFDPDGYAEITRLRRGSDAEFKINDIGVFPYSHEVDKQIVDRLVADGIATIVGRPYFVRNLRDYEEAFHDIQDKFIKRNEDIRRTQRDIAALQTSIQKVAAQSQYRQGEKAELEQDQGKILIDKEKVTDLVASLDAQKTSLLDELSRLNRTNLALSQELTRINDVLTKEINRRTAEATAQLQ